MSFQIKRKQLFDELSNVECFVKKRCLSTSYTDLSNKTLRMEVFNNVKWVKIGFKDECEKKSSFFCNINVIRWRRYARWPLIVDVIKMWSAIFLLSSSGPVLTSPQSSIMRESLSPHSFFLLNTLDTSGAQCLFV